MNDSWTKISLTLGLVLAVLLLSPRMARADEDSDEDSSSAAMVTCDQPYALCTSAPCIPDPDDPEGQAICECSVHNGESLGMTSCLDRAKKVERLVYAGLPTGFGSGEREPIRIDSATKLVTSTFSDLEFGPKKALVCPSGYPWTDCLDAPCTINPMDSGQAICRCPIVREAVFLTLGGNCDTDTCPDGYWSAATIPMMAASLPGWQQYVCENQVENIEQAVREQID